MEELRYPIGRVRLDPELTEARRNELIEEIARLPDAIRGAVDGLTPAQLDTENRPGGWTVRQVVHHLADSHLHSYIRFKQAVTQNEPAISTYDEAAWSELADARTGDPEISLALLRALHTRWTHFLRSLTSREFERAYLHPEQGRVTLSTAVQIYAWHGRHHLAHITALRARMHW